eukprot:CAMPEP_0177168160 /NCGR_PEP_ID=MMETSP0367-20130122/8923_1 /TAXON_ID=447022 ORGANISM="Scrippsiella hangoei-like, Strain SHHI-4" /NCGR_SAMPLE_ID=MMETSP0367 /ASSEMBLY_ACC=CAM_ASM_000362 /LENGTH=262 /DNA_ID=CAMNT_0018614285 /DNA_START=154 /DNA_END=938 /DNA_ORIENTATION=+
MSTSTGSSKSTCAADGAEFERLYSVGALLGKGSFGKVYTCEPLRRGDGHDEDVLLCVKVVPSRGGRAENGATESERAFCEILCRLEHPNIVKSQHFFYTVDSLHVVMDRCCGLDLVDYVKERGGCLPSSEVRILARQVLAAVAALHRVGLAHRDVKPENLRFKDASAQVLQLLDFGCAKAMPERPMMHSVTGTLLYAAPEVFEGHYCRSCDLWSAGVVFFQLFTGHLPFQTPSVQILRSLHRDPVLRGEGLFRGESRRKVPR